MKFIIVKSDDDPDFGAMIFEDNYKGDYLELWNEAHNNNDILVITVAVDDNPDCSGDITIKAVEFDITKEAFEFLVDFYEDYDVSKGKNIFPVEPWN
jgi:hypothetical protein